MEQKINYIKAHKAIQLLSKNDIELRPIHKSILDALFMFWNKKDWADLFNIDRNDLMEYSRISSRKTYYETLSFLQEKEYIIYKPSKNPDIASVFGMGKKVTSAITSNGSCDITSTNTSDTPSSSTIYKNIETINTKTLKLINENASLIEECLDGWISSHTKPEKEDFEKAWVAYGKKGNKKNAQKRWEKVTTKDFEDIMNHIPVYMNSVSDRKYLKDFEGYLNQEHWKSEISSNKSTKPQVEYVHFHSPSTGTSVLTRDRFESRKKSYEPLGEIFEIIRTEFRDAD